MEETKKIDTKGNIFYFFIFTLGYTIILQLTGGNKLIWTAIYLLLVLASQYFINLQLSKSLCGSEQHGEVFSNTFLPWLLILCTTMVFINIFPGWLRPFSNTLGYTAAKFAGIDNLCKQIFKNGISMQPSGNSDRKIVENLENIYNNPGQMINDIDLKEKLPIDNKDPTKTDWGFWVRMKHAKLLKDSILNNNIEEEKFKNKLKKLVELKDNIARFFRYLLSGILCIIVSENFILGTTCKKSLEDLEGEYDEYLEEKNNEKNNKPDKVGTSSSGAEMI